jgi:uncharacterized caspase-like protein
MRWSWQALIGLALAWLPAVEALADKRVALVIGNAAYQNVAKLPNPVNDAEAMATLLTAAGFRVDLRRNLGGNEMRRAIREFSRQTLDADMAVVFYAGHGIELGGNNYLIPTDAKLESDIDVQDETVSMDRVMSMIEPARRLQLILLDACRDNPFPKRMKRTMASRGVGRGLAQVEPASSNTLIAFAAKAGSLAIDDAGGSNSPFTTALLNHLTTPGLDLRLAFGRVRDEVLRRTKQMQEPFVYGSLGGEPIALVAAPDSPRVETTPIDPHQQERQDYELAERVGTMQAWSWFLNNHGAGFYADLAQAQRKKLTELVERAERAAREEQIRRSQEADKAAEAPRLQELRRAEEAKRAEDVRRAEEAKNAAKAERMEKERLARQRAEKDPLAKEQADREREERERIEKERIAAEQAQRERIEKDRAREQAERDRADKERVLREQAERERAEQEGVARAQTQQESAEMPATMQVTALAPPAEPVAVAPPVPSLPRAALVEDIKAELKRVGCYAGPIDNQWKTDQTSSAVKKFVRYAHAAAVSDQPTVDFLDSLRTKSDRVCPVECGPGEVEAKGQCVSKTCRRGFTLDHNGDCVKTKHGNNAEKPRHRDEATSGPRRQEARSARRGGQGPHNVCLQPALCGDGHD